MSVEFSTIHSSENYLRYSDFMKKIQDGIIDKKHITELRFIFNKLTSLPRVVTELSLLRGLSIRNNLLISLPADIGQLRSLIHLNINNNQLLSLPSEIGQLKSLIKLLLIDNQLTSLPAEIGQLSSLVILDVDYNCLTSLPAEIGQLRSLIHLDINNNRLTSLPAEIGQLSSLTYLELCHNQLTSLPTEIGQLSSLTRLDLSSNQLTSLPDEIGQLSSLTHLYLHNNQLTSLPAEIGQLSSLNDLYLHDNQLTSIPTSLINLTSIIYFKCDENLHDQRDMIVNEIKLKRSKQSSHELPQKFKFWLAYCGSSNDKLSNETFIESLTEEQSIHLYEYLTRLQQVKDFSHNPTRLANHLFDFLKLTQGNNEFADIFYTELKENNTCCQDRTAMSTNIIYTYYIVFSLNENNKSISLNSSTIKKFVSLAKTITLRSLIQNYLIKNPSAESVEIYLYYESNLKNQLNLTTVMESMSYPSVGNKQIDLTFDYLISEVNRIYMIYLLNCEPFMNLVKSNEGYKIKLDNNLNEAYKQLELNPENSIQIMEDKTNKDLQLINNILTTIAD